MSIKKQNKKTFQQISTAWENKKGSSAGCRNRSCQEEETPPPPPPHRPHAG